MNTIADLYPILLKNTLHQSFGINPSNIMLKTKQGEVVVKAKKLLVTYNGEENEPVDCQSVEVKFEDDTIMLNIVTVKDGQEQPRAEDIPQTEAVVPPAVTDKFVLQGDDLEAFELLSDLRRTENQGQKTENSTLEAHTIESGVFDIQDLMSVQNATLDIVEREKQFIDQGYTVFKTNTPRFDYENANNFKLVESIVLIKPIKSTEIVEDK